jgi:hypothetical protein
MYINKDTSLQEDNTAGTTRDPNLSIICKQTLKADKSIRFAGIANNLGSLLATEYREGLVPLMTRQQTSQYAMEAVLRAAIREEFESTIGRLQYSIGKHEKLIHATVPVTFKNLAYDESEDMKFYLLLSFDIDSDAKTVIDKKILPSIKENKQFFIYPN